MPNVEIHGLGDEIGMPRVLIGAKRGLIEQLVNGITTLFADTPYRGEVVITMMSDVVHDLDGNPRPFLRLVSTAKDHDRDVLDKLKTLGMDLEHLVLAHFYEAT